MFQSKFLKRILYLLPLFLLFSCGGGSSSSEMNNTNDQNLQSAACEDYPSSFLGTTFSCRIIHQNTSRLFFVYLGSSYLTNAPVLFSLHGYGSRAEWNMNYSGFQPIADSNGALVIYPQGTLLPATGETHWNVGGWTISSETDDVGFIEVVIDFLENRFSINPKKVYSTGMSNGGYMSYKLACELNQKIAAIVSVTGSMTPETYNSCNPNKAVPIGQIHGLQDFVVSYYGSSWSLPIQEVIESWVEINNCDIDFIRYEIDGGIHDIYSDCSNNVNVELFLLTDMGHDWPSQSIHGLEASTTVWNFLSRYDIDGLIE